jgi:hypothetical protein
LRTKKASSKNTKKKNAKIRIAKCWSLIRFIAECPTIGYSNILEQIALPLLQQIAQPVDYDDDIIFFVGSILKKQKQPSQLMLDILQYLPEVNLRNKCIMGPMLETLCLYTLYHTNWTNPEIQILLTICHQSINPPVPNSKIDENISYSSEGCLLLQSMLLNIQHKDLVPLVMSMNINAELSYVT